MIITYDGETVTPKKAAALEIRAMINEHQALNMVMDVTRMSDREFALVEKQYNEYVERINKKILTILEEGGEG